MGTTERQLKEYLKKDILCSIDYASKIAVKPQIVEELSILLANTEHLGFWDLLDVLQGVNMDMFCS